MTEPLDTSRPIAGVEPHTLRADQICDEPPALFSLGNVVATPAALTLIQKYGASVPQLLNRHQIGDWQELSKEDRDNNWEAAFGDARVLSAFNIGSADEPVKIWVITEWDRSVTTILRPQDY